MLVSDRKIIGADMSKPAVIQNEIYTWIGKMKFKSHVKEAEWNELPAPVFTSRDNAQSRISGT